MSRQLPNLLQRGSSALALGPGPSRSCCLGCCRGTPVYYGIVLYGIVLCGKVWYVMV